MLMFILQHEAYGTHSYESSELTCDEKQAILLSIDGCTERAPMLLAMFLRTAISSHKDYISEPVPPEMMVMIYGDNDE